MADYQATTRFPFRPLSYEYAAQAVPKELVADYRTGELYICDTTGTLIGISEKVKDLVRTDIQHNTGDYIDSEEVASLVNQEITITIKNSEGVEETYTLDAGIAELTNQIAQLMLYINGGTYTDPETGEEVTVEGINEKLDTLDPDTLIPLIEQIEKALGMIDEEGQPITPDPDALTIDERIKAIEESLGVDEDTGTISIDVTSIEKRLASIAKILTFPTTDGAYNGLLPTTFAANTIPASAIKNDGTKAVLTQAQYNTVVAMPKTIYKTVTIDPGAWKAGTGNWSDAYIVGIIVDGVTDATEVMVDLVTSSTFSQSEKEEDAYMIFKGKTYANEVRLANKVKPTVDLTLKIQITTNRNYFTSNEHLSTENLSRCTSSNSTGATTF